MGSSLAEQSSVLSPPQTIPIAAHLCLNPKPIFIKKAGLGWFIGVIDPKTNSNLAGQSVLRAGSSWWISYFEHIFVLLKQKRKKKEVIQCLLLFSFF